jgi:ATP adenylyltransferase
VSGFKAGRLWDAVCRQNAHALSKGVVQLPEVQHHVIEDGGVQFLAAVVSNLSRKDQAKKELDEKALHLQHDIDPFLPYEADLFVADLSATHLALLNKFNVVNHHFLIVSRDFVDQETLLGKADFQAVWNCLSQVEGLVCYNAGPVAGASQRHRHIQFLPSLKDNALTSIPMERFLAAEGDGPLSSSPHLLFNHAFIRFAPVWPKDEKGAVETLSYRYQTMLHALGMGAVHGNGEPRQNAAYNLLITRCWMLLVRRTVERYEGISVNGFCFAGLFFLRHTEHLDMVRRAGPLAFLRNVAP